MTDVAAAAGRGPWRERIAALARGMRDELERHPGLVADPPAPDDDPAATVRRDRGGGAGAGRRGPRPRAEAARAFRVLFTYIFGFVAFSPRRRPTKPRREMRVALAALPPDDYPTITSMTDEAVDGRRG